MYLKDKDNLIISTIPVPFLNRYPEQNKFESNTETFIINTFTESNEISVYENGDILLYKTPIILKGIETKLIIEYKYTNNWNIKARFSPPFYLKSNIGNVINIISYNINNSEVIVNITPDFDNINVYDIATNRLLKTINVDKNVTITLNINYTESDNIVTIEDVIINKISSTLYLKSENGNLNDFVNELNRMKFLDNYEGEVGVNIIPSQSTRLMVYETLTNKFIHITDCLIKSVYITINFKYKFIDGKWIISSNIETLNPLPVPNFSIDRNRPSNFIGQTEDLVINRNFECPEGSIISRVHTEAGQNSHIWGIDSQCINPYTQQVTSTIGYYGSRADIKQTCLKPGGYSRMYASGCRYVHQVLFDDCYNGYNTDNSSSCGSFTEQNFNCLNGKISNDTVTIKGQLHNIKAYCSYPTIK